MHIAFINLSIHIDVMWVLLFVASVRRVRYKEVMLGNAEQTVKACHKYVKKCILAETMDNFFFSSSTLPSSSDPTNKSMRAELARERL